MRVVLLCIILAGCATGPTAEQRQAANDRYWAGLAHRCSQMGYTGDGQRNCIMQLHQLEEQRRAAIGAALIGSGALRQQPTYQPVQPTPMRPPQQTNCYWVGNQIHCSSQ